jgi:hypothetical protein
VVAVRTDAVAEALTPTIAPARGLGAAKVRRAEPVRRFLPTLAGLQRLGAGDGAERGIAAGIEGANTIGAASRTTTLAQARSKTR